MKIPCSIYESLSLSAVALPGIASRRFPPTLVARLCMTTIDSQHLRVVSVLARHLNMSRAAQELKLTPSGISHCLKAIEGDLGCRLFERSSRHVALTAAGAEFLSEAEAILQRMTVARSKLRNWHDVRSNHLRIAAGTTASQHLLPPALREFRESFPGCTIQIALCNAAQAVAAIANGEADVAVCVQPPMSPGTHFIPLAEDELRYLTNPMHPWALNRRAGRDNVTGQKFILPARGTATHALIESYFRRAGVRLQSFIEIGNEEVIKQFVRLDLGVALLPRWIAEAEIRQGSLVCLPLGRRRLRRRWGVLHARQHRLTFAETVLIDLCRNVATGLMTESAS
jgi:DNA-binding transcriptional LysR family regulator